MLIEMLVRAPRANTKGADKLASHNFSILSASSHAVCVKTSCFAQRVGKQIAMIEQLADHSVAMAPLQIALGNATVGMNHTMRKTIQLEPVN